MSPRHCQCCMQTLPTGLKNPTCELCGWVQGRLDETGYSLLNGKYLSKARSEFLRALPARIDAAIRAIGG